MKKIFKNISQNKINLLGIEILPGGEYDVPVVKWLKLGQLESVINWINNDEAILNNGERDLNKEDSLKLLTFNLMDASNIIFNSSQNSFNSQKVQDAIEEVLELSNNITTEQFQIVLVKNGSSRNFWWSISEAGISSHRSPIIVPFNCRVKYITFTNRQKNKNDNLELALYCYEKNLEDDGDFKPNCTIAWYIDSNGPGIINKKNSGHVWTYNDWEEEDFMQGNKKYAFRTETLNNANVDDAVITITLEKVI